MILFVWVRCPSHARFFLDIAFFLCLCVWETHLCLFLVAQEKKTPPEFCQWDCFFEQLGKGWLTRHLAVRVFFCSSDLSPTPFFFTQHSAPTTSHNPRTQGAYSSHTIYTRILTTKTTFTLQGLIIKQQSKIREWQTTSRRTRSGSRTWVGTSTPTTTLSTSTVSSPVSFSSYHSILPSNNEKHRSKSAVEVWYVDIWGSLLETIGNMFDFGTQSDYYEFVHGSDLFSFLHLLFFMFFWLIVLSIGN